jgi:hypothetical protein
VAAVEARLAAADASLASEQAKTEKAIAAFAALAERLDALAFSPTGCLSWSAPTKSISLLQGSRELWFTLRRPCSRRGRNTGRSRHSWRGEWVGPPQERPSLPVAIMAPAA